MPQSAKFSALEARTLDARRAMGLTPVRSHDGDNVRVVRSWRRSSALAKRWKQTFPCHPSSSTRWLLVAA
jgi:hypothetical protein